LGHPIESIERDQISALVAERGEREAARLLCIADRTLMRCLAGLGVNRGTRALVAQALDRLEGGTHG
jgi:hypothetical protein